MRRTAAVLAVALALGAAPAGADAPAGGDPSGRKAQRAGEWLREKARLGAKLPGAVTYDAAELVAEWAELADAGDLDGDGKSDVVDVRARLEYDEVLGFRETVKIEAYRGYDGKALWARDLPTASFVFPMVTTVGLDGAPGVVVVTYQDAEDGTESAGGGGYAAAVTSFDRTGTPLWVRPLDGSWGYVPMTFAAQVTEVEGLIDAVAGGGRDLLLRTTLMAEAADPVGEQPSTVQFSVLDAATGAVKPIGQPLTTEAPSGTVLPGGDLDGDKLDDVVFEVATSTTSSLVALSSADGRQLWKLANVAGSSAHLMLTDLPDATGDGRSDIGALILDFGGGVIVEGGPRAASSLPMPGSTVALVDGARGRLLWSKKASALMALGDVDRRPGIELGVGTPVYERNRSGFTVSAFTAAGRRVWSTTRTLKTSGAMSAFSEIGDVGGDGVAEVGYAVVSGFGRTARRDEGVIDGRTGRVRKDPRPGMYATRAALDGRGSDAYEADSGRGTFTLHTWRGDKPARLWSAAVRAVGIHGRSLPVAVDGDKCTDIAFTLETATTFRSVVFAGSTGRPLWQLDRSGNAAGVAGKPSVVSHRTYQRGC
ncbi:MAG TPA: hypothetical protein VNA20_18760 [Frankiaceae bacterium]|nr:hypothetical protein [Frankiaceae bacterium]